MQAQIYRAEVEDNLVNRIQDLSHEYIMGYARAQAIAFDHSPANVSRETKSPQPDISPIISNNND